MNQNEKKNVTRESSGYLLSEYSLNTLLQSSIKFLSAEKNNNFGKVAR